MSTESTTPQNGYKKVLSGVDITLLTICAILGLDSLTSMASSGPSAIFWLALTIILFLIPYSLITAELSSAYPGQGGLYLWVRRAMGPRWAGRASWLYWVNIAIWMPSIFIVFASTLSQLFFPNLGIWPQILIAVFMSWVAVFLNIIPLQKSKHIATIGGIIKVAIMLLIGIGGILYGLRNGIANPITWQSITPTWEIGIGFLPVIVYSFLGMELLFSASGEIHNPARSGPPAILISTIVISLIYLAGTIGMLMALPTSELTVTEGVIGTLRVIFGQSGFAQALVIIFGITVLYTLLAFITVWMMAGNRMLVEASRRGDLPAMLGKTSTFNTPLTASILSGLISTVAIVIYGLLAGGNALQLYTILFDLSSIALLIPYLFMFIAFIELRRIDSDTPRPFKVPLGYSGSVLLSAISFLFILQAIVFFVWTPGQPIDWLYASLVIGGMIIIIVIGEVLMQRAQKDRIH